MPRSSTARLSLVLAFGALGACASSGTPAPAIAPAAARAPVASPEVNGGPIWPSPAALAADPAREYAGTRGPKFDIAYRLAMPDPGAHLYDVTLDIGNVSGDSVELQLPVWSPGRYARFDFARNVQELTISGGNTPIEWGRVNGSLWRVYPHGASSLTVHYRVFANTLSGTFSVLDSAHANWNGASLFMYVAGHKADPVRLHVDIPAGWHIMNGDAKTDAQADFAFENYDRLIDTPTEVAPTFMLDSFTVNGRTYRTMVHHNGAPPAGIRERFVKQVQQIVTYENGVFGPPPLQAYTFVFNIGYPGGDGMEHLYSTEIIDRRRWADSLTPLPGIATAAHEYFHVWNVKRVRPVALGPFDYTREQYQPSLWVAEGWTQYYGMAALPRAGVLPASSFLSTMTILVRANLTAPGRKEVSARMASFEAPFWDGSSGGYANNGSQTFFTYYYKGAGVALYLDLMIRARTHNQRSLDDAFRNLKHIAWDAPSASYYLQGRGYTEADVERAVSEAAGTDVHDWFVQHVAGKADIDYDQALGWAGLRLVRGSSDWTIESVPNPTAEQLAVRSGWMTGTTTAALR